MLLNFTLASRNLFHDRLRCIATTVGIVFSVVLVMVQMGLYLGFGQMVTKMIDHASADLWVMRQGTKCFEDPSLLDDNDWRTIVHTNGVASVSTLIIGFSDWKLSDGAMTPVFIVGSYMGDDVLRPWNMTQGSIKELTAPHSVAVDLSYDKRLGVSKLGDTAEIRSRTVHVAAFTNGIRSFTTTPYVFTDLKYAREYTGIPNSKVSYFLVKLKPGADLSSVRHDLQQQLKNVEVLTPTQFRDRSRTFWLFGTGAGMALFAGALLGVIVGTVIVAQTLYSSTKDHLDEFATLRAIGSSNRYIYSVIIFQALLNAIIGFCLASLVGYVVVWMTTSGALPVVITTGLMIGVFILTVLMCVASAFFAILRVIRIDPVMAFTR
jgi:putative ABC transport system permease protein